MGQPRINGRTIKPGEGPQRLLGEMRRGVIDPRQAIGALTTGNTIQVDCGTQTAQTALVPIELPPPDVISTNQSSQN